MSIVYRYAYRLCGDMESANDLVQETFLNAFRGMNAFRGDAQVSTCCIPLHRGQPCACVASGKARLSGSSRWKNSSPRLTVNSACRFRSRASRRSRRSKTGLREALDHAINKLPKKYRIALVLRDMEGLSAKGVSGIMGLSERAVKSRLHRARLFVRRELSGDLQEHPRPDAKEWRPRRSGS